MNGLDLLFTNYHINPAMGASRAVQEVSKLGLSVGTIGYFIREAVELGEGEAIEIPADVDRAQLTLSYMVQTGVRNNVRKFSVDAFNELRQRALDLTLYSERSDAINTEVVADVEVCDNPGAEVIQVNKPIRAPKPVAVAREPKVTTPKPPVAEGEKSGRGRKADPNSNSNKAIALWAATPEDQRTRDAFVALLQAQLGLPFGTATTYYYLARKSA